MNAFHVLSTKPKRTYYGREHNQNFHLEDYEVLTVITSALQWRLHNGSIKLYTDKIGAAYFDKLGISNIWDAGVDTDTLEKADIKTNQTIFWASARTSALAKEKAPCILLDMDLIVWKEISKLISSRFMAIHSEDINFKVYGPKEQLHTANNYTWEPFDWTVSPVNAALLYFKDDAIREYCVCEGLKFYHNNYPEKEEKGLPVNAIFVEQRLYPMCAHKLGIKTDYFLKDYNGDQLKNGMPNTMFSHIWNYKFTLAKNRRARYQLCTQITGRILQDFPEFRSILLNIPELRSYVISYESNGILARNNSNMA